MVRLYHNNCCKETFFGQIKKNKIFPSSCDFVGVFRNALSAPRIVNPPPPKKKFIFVTGNEKGVGYFPAVQLTSNNFPSGNFPHVRSYEAPQAAMGAKRCG